MITDSRNGRQMSDCLIDDHAQHLRASASDRTIEDRTEVLRRLNTYLPFGLAFAATEQIEAFLADLRQRGRARWTINTYLGHIRGFYAWADGRVLDGDPTLTITRMPNPKCVPKPVTDDELARALESRDPWFVAIVLAAFGGLRADEIARAHRDDITEEHVTVVGKGGDLARVPTNAFLWAVVKDRTGLLFTPGGQKVTGRWVSAHARHHFDALGLPRVHMHRLRHWYGTTIQRQQGDIRVTQTCLRHRSVTSTEGYTMVSGDAVRAAVASLPIPRGARASR